MIGRKIQTDGYFTADGTFHIASDLMVLLEKLTCCETRGN